MDYHCNSHMSQTRGIEVGIKFQTAPRTTRSASIRYRVIIFLLNIRICGVREVQQYAAEAGGHLRVRFRIRGYFGLIIRDYTGGIIDFTCFYNLTGR